MNQKAQDYINQKLEENHQKKLEARNRFLISQGLYEKEYSPNGNYTSEHTESEWCDETHSNKYYRTIPIEVTDEEFEEIEKAYKLSQSSNTLHASATNPVAKALQIIAVFTYIIGIILGGIEVNKTEDISGGLFYWTTYFVVGTMILGFSEIIKLLNDIKNK